MRVEVVDVEEDMSPRDAVQVQIQGFEKASKRRHYYRLLHRGFSALVCLRLMTNGCVLTWTVFIPDFNGEYSDFRYA